MSSFVSVSEETSNKLIQMILVEKKYAPGSRIPNEKDLSTELAVSRTSVREAVKILLTNGVLEIRRGVGTFVTRNPPINSSSLLEFCSDTNKQYAIDALNIRLALEPTMISLAVLIATAEEKELMYKYEAECKSLILSKKDYTYADRLFHKSLAIGAHNAIYEKLLPILHTSISIILRSGDFEKTAKKSAENALIYHWKIVDAMKNGDAKGAEIASKTHIYNSIRYLGEYL